MSAPAPSTPKAATATPAPMPGARLVLALGSLVFLHAAYSTYEFISVYKALGHSGITLAFSLPLSIRIETIAGLVIVIVGLVMTANPLEDITWAEENRKKSIDEVDARPSFTTLNHRGQYVFGDNE